MTDDQDVTITLPQRVWQEVENLLGQHLTSHDLRIAFAALRGEDPDTSGEDEPRIPCHFEVTDELDDIEYGNVVADNGGDVLDENITRTQYTEQHPDNLY